MDTSHSSLNGFPTPSSDISPCMPVETSVNSSSEEKALRNSEDQEKEVNSMPEGIPLPTGLSNLEYPANDVNIFPPLNFAEHSCTRMDPAVDSSLEDRVARFIQNGELDVIEDNVYDMFNEGTEESERFIQPKNEAEIQSNIPSVENFQHVVSRSNIAFTRNGSVSLSKHDVAPMMVNHLVRNDDMSAEGPAISNLEKDLEVETGKTENQVEINHLQFMLHQKEFELSCLKEHIEKEKLALSDLQTKAETEISKAQKLIAEKDAELLAAEESLSGLVEVQIQYSGDAENVEVSGSFNGWHLKITMDPQPSSGVVDPTGSRESTLWSTVLWLYPGVYEIKFIVDGQWIIDPQRESVSKGGISNNILRVVG